MEAAITVIILTDACVQGADGFRRCASPADWGWSGDAGDGEG